MILDAEQKGLITPGKVSKFNSISLYILLFQKSFWLRVH